MTASDALFVEDVRVGDAVPPYSVELTLQRLVMEAGANRDFAPMHFDPAAATEGGAQGIFANTMLLQTLFEVMLRRWMGLPGRIRKVGFRMHAMNFVDQTLTAHAVVRSVGAGETGQRVELEIWQETPAQGRTVTGQAVVELPSRDD